MLLNMDTTNLENSKNTFQFFNLEIKVYERKV